MPASRPLGRVLAAGGEKTRTATFPQCLIDAGMRETWLKPGSEHAWPYRHPADRQAGRRSNLLPAAEPLLAAAAAPRSLGLPICLPMRRTTLRRESSRFHAKCIFSGSGMVKTWTRMGSLLATLRRRASVIIYGKDATNCTPPSNSGERFVTP